MGVGERRVLAVFYLATALLVAVGIPSGWSGETLGTAFIVMAMVATAVGASIAPRETPRR